MRIQPNPIPPLSRAAASAPSSIDSIVIVASSAGLFFATAGITLYERPTTCAQVVASPGEKSSSERCSDDLDITINNDRLQRGHLEARSLGDRRRRVPALSRPRRVDHPGHDRRDVGQGIFGIRTVERGWCTRPASASSSSAALLWIVDGLCDGLIAAILILVTKGHRRLGDMAAKTFVVRAGAKGSPIVVPGLEAAAVGAGAAAPVGAYGARQSTPSARARTHHPHRAPWAPPRRSRHRPRPLHPRRPRPRPPTPAPEPSGPQWDAGRNAYIQWDPAGNRWLTYDDAASEWKPIEGEQPPPPA